MHADLITLAGLRVNCRIGVTAAERRRPRPIVISASLGVNLRRAARSDCLDDTVDYAGLSARIAQAVQSRSWSLLEAVAGCAADVCLREPLVRAVRIEAVKSRPVRNLASAAVVICRRRK